MNKAILISIGGTPAPLVYTLNQTKPFYIIFFASDQTKESIPTLLRSLDFHPKGIDHIITPSAEVLGECYQALVQQLPQKLQTWGITPRELLVDYTGGTKTMSASIVLATIELGCNYSYVGGIERNKDGIGVVIDGKEKMWYVNNPWDEMAISERKKVNILFNKARYSAAIDVMTNICAKVSPQMKPFYEMWLEIIQGYEAWDKFSHKKAHLALRNGIKKLKLVATNTQSLQQKVKEIEKNVSFLGQLTEGKNEELLVYDLVANAMRRADLENKYDDAVARLYRAIEKAAQDSLLVQYKIRTSNVDPDGIPESLKAEYLQRYVDRGGRIKLPLYASYRLLKEKGHELGVRFFDKYNAEIKPLLDRRNTSILAHGDQTIDKESYQKLLSVVIDFIMLEKEQIPIFPELEI